MTFLSLHFYYNSNLNLGVGLWRVPWIDFVNVAQSQASARLQWALALAFGGGGKLISFPRVTLTGRCRPQSYPKCCSSTDSAIRAGLSGGLEMLAGASRCWLRPLQPMSSAVIWHKYVQRLKTYCGFRWHNHREKWIVTFFKRLFSLFSTANQDDAFLGTYGKGHSDAGLWCKWILFCFCCSTGGNARNNHPEFSLQFGNQSWNQTTVNQTI